MPDPITIALSPHQQAHFTDLLSQERDAQKVLDAVGIARKHAALAVIAQQYDLATIAGNVSVGADSLTFTQKEPTPDPAATPE